VARGCILLVGNRTFVEYSSVVVRITISSLESDFGCESLEAGLYDYQTTLLLPYSTTNVHRFQTQREYLLSLLLINAAYLLHHWAQWVNDNIGAIAWVNTHNCSSPSCYNEQGKVTNRARGYERKVSREQGE
jgi:hypothetical protein